MKTYHIAANTINEAWFKAIKTCVEFGRNYVIDKGEYEGQLRRELDYAVIRIEKPGIRPLACQSQQIVPTTDEKIAKYFMDYLMDPEFADEEEAKNNVYKYSTFIAPRWQQCCELLLEGDGGCNQATVSLGESPGETFAHPPCLRLIDMRVRYGALHFFIYFRSWDLVAGFPENLGGLQLLKEHCLEYINQGREAMGHSPLKDGCIIATSKGLHIYEMYWKLIDEFGGQCSVLELPGINVL